MKSSFNNKGNLVLELDSEDQQMLAAILYHAAKSMRKDKVAGAEKMMKSIENDLEEIKKISKWK